MPEPPPDGHVLAEAIEVADRERAKLASLLHDYALQSLLLARQELEEGEVEAAQRALEVGIAQLRETVEGVHTMAHEHAGIEAAIARIASDAAARSGLSATVEVAEGVGEPHDTLLLALARELVGNVERHAGASRMRVALREERGGLELEVDDDGRGFDGRRRVGPDASPTRALGLASIEQRVRAAGGTLELFSADGFGTSVTARIPRD